MARNTPGSSLSLPGRGAHLRSADGTPRDGSQRAFLFFFRSTEPGLRPRRMAWALNSRCNTGTAQPLRCGGLSGPPELFQSETNQRVSGPHHVAPASSWSGPGSAHGSNETVHPPVVIAATPAAARSHASCQCEVVRSPRLLRALWSPKLGRRSPSPGLILHPEAELVSGPIRLNSLVQVRHIPRRPNAVCVSFKRLRFRKRRCWVRAWP